MKSWFVDDNWKLWPLKTGSIGSCTSTCNKLALIWFPIISILRDSSFYFYYLYTLCTILSVVIKLNKNVTYQKVFGFGGAMTDAAGINIASLSSGTADNLIKAYYSHDG